MVVLEPSCAAALRTDLPELLADDPRAARLADRGAHLRAGPGGAAPPTGSRPASTAPSPARPTATSTRSSATRPTAACANARASTGALTGGCCGLAGNFGFETGHYEVSVACAEDQLLPAVRDGHRGDGGPRGRLLLPHPARPAGRTGRAGIWRRCWRRRWGSRGRWGGRESRGSRESRDPWARSGKAHQSVRGRCAPARCAPGGTHRCVTGLDGRECVHPQAASVAASAG